MRTLNLELPEKLEPLIFPARYKGVHGGRGGAKSHAFGALAVVECVRQPTRIVCIREVQNSIKDSVKQLIESKIASMQLSPLFEVLRDEVRGPNGSLIIFRGMQDYNSDNIKSLEGFDRAWVEEAQNLSARSWRLLRPTIRKQHSEIWCSWNPRWDTDAVDEFFRGPNKSPDSVCIEINWQDNPWFPDVLRTEMLRDFANDPEMAQHVWNGGYEIVSEGAYYARLLAQAEKEGRIGAFPYKPGQRVTTAWDLGISDFMTCWFLVEDGMFATAVDYYEASGEDFAEFVSTCLPELFIPPDWSREYDHWSREQALGQLKRDIPFRYAQHYLPHDVQNRELGGGRRHRFQVLEALGVRNQRKGVPVNPEERVAATRRILPQMRFHDCPRVQLGLKRLRRYRRKFNDALGSYTTPIHDENSHGADAFGEYAINSQFTTPLAPVASAKPEELAFGVDPKTRAIVANMNVKEIVEMKEKLAKMGKKRGLQL